MQRLGLPMLGALALLLPGALACPDAAPPGIDCDRLAVPLFRRCDQRFSKADPWRCLGTYAGTEETRFARADAQTVALCKAAAPEGETACYESATCQEVEMGACIVDTSLRNRIEEACRMGCEQAVVSCQVPCTAQGSADACDQCVLDCESERVGCFGRCPLKEEG